MPHRKPIKKYKMRAQPIKKKMPWHCEESDDEMDGNDSMAVNGDWWEKPSVVYA